MRLEGVASYRRGEMNRYWGDDGITLLGNGKTIQIEAFEITADRVASHVERFFDRVPFCHDSRKCRARSDKAACVLVALENNGVGEGF